VSLGTFAGHYEWADPSKNLGFVKFGGVKKIPARDSRGSRRDFRELVFPEFHFGTTLHQSVSQENYGTITHNT